MKSHELLAQHYFLDSIDLHHRFRTHWDKQPRKSSRIKSFIDLLMACECILKSQCIAARNTEPLSNAYNNVKRLGHSIGKLSLEAEATFPSSSHGRVRFYFDNFPVGLRYSADAYHFFFPIVGRPPKSDRSYATTLGNATWMDEAEDSVKNLIEWGKERFNCEVDFDIEEIFNAELDIRNALHTSSKT